MDLEKFIGVRLRLRYIGRVPIIPQGGYRIRGYKTKQVTYTRVIMCASFVNNQLILQTNRGFVILEDRNKKDITEDIFSLVNGNMLFLQFSKGRILQSNKFRKTTIFRYRFPNSSLRM